MSKGSGRRPAVADDATVAANWAAIFGERQRDQAWVEQDRAEHFAAASQEHSQVAPVTVPVPE